MFGCLWILSAFGLQDDILALSSRTCCGITFTYKHIPEQNFTGFFVTLFLRMTLLQFVILEQGEADAIGSSAFI